jgi:hypothetical protein
MKPELRVALPEPPSLHSMDRMGDYPFHLDPEISINLADNQLQKKEQRLSPRLGGTR